jgi:cytochrome c peroxidase
MLSPTIVIHLASRSERFLRPFDVALEMRPPGRVRRERNMSNETNPRKRDSTDFAQPLVAALSGIALAGCTAAATGVDDPPVPPVESTLSVESADLSPEGDGSQRGTMPGLRATTSTNGFATGSTDGFFANLGTNRRTCSTCHIEQDGWTFTPASARALSAHDPLFAPNDGSDCPPTSPSQGPDKSMSSEVTEYGLIRVQIGIPDGAGFALLSATNPKSCPIAPGSAGAGGQLFLFRRPPPSTNLVFDTAIMWDGRESTPPTTQKITTEADFTSEGPLLFDLADQANSATMGHAQGASIAGTQAQSDVVAFESNLYTGRYGIWGDGEGPILLDADGANGGPAYIASKVAPAFFVGVNDPLQPGFTSTTFTLYQAWEPTSARYGSLSKEQQAIGRGETIFNGATFVIHDVPGLNSIPGDPLYNPADPFAGQDVRGGCGVCHNSPNVGNHSSSLPINIGVTMARPVNNDGAANRVLDIANLPVYTLSNPSTGETVQVTDPGRALVTGKWTDIGKTKGPNLRGLSMRAPFFHNGSARDLPTVVDFYNARFAIGLTAAQMSDLVEFLGAL